MPLFLSGFDYYSLNFLEKRKEFLSVLLRVCEYEAVIIPNTSKYIREKTSANYLPEFKMYVLSKNETGEFELSRPSFFNGLNFNPDWNTRDILLSEAVIELEKAKTWEENIKAFWKTIESLINFKIHFAVFYAEGMRTPHIHIYNLFPMVEDWAEKELSMALFCRQVVPFECFNLLDTALFGQHTIALEFSKHYKYGTMNKLLFEHVPNNEVNKNENSMNLLKGSKRENEM